MAILCRLDILFSVIQLIKFQVVPREEHLKVAYRVWEYLKNNSRFSTLIDPSKPNFDYNTTVLYKEIFMYSYLDAYERRASGFKWESLVSGLVVY